MTDPAVAQPARPSRAGRPDSPAAAPAARLSLDSRRPLILDDGRSVLRVTAGYVDLFAVPIEKEGGGVGARHHLIRVDSGEIVLGLPSIDADGGSANRRPRGRRTRRRSRRSRSQRSRIATRSRPGSFGCLRPSSRPAPTGARPRPRSEPHANCARVSSCALRGTASRGSASSTARFDWADWRRSAGPAILPCRLRRRHGSTRRRAPPFALSAATRFSPPIRGPPIDRFHAHAMACIAGRMTLARDAEFARLRQRAEQAAAQASQPFNELAAAIRPRRRMVGVAVEGADPLLDACSIVAETIGVDVVRPPNRHAAMQAPSDVADIARASRVRSRPILLRADWWQRGVGSLVAWHGELLDPVAIVPVSTKRYVMVQPATRTRTPVDASVAAQLHPEAVMFYQPLPPLLGSARQLLGSLPAAGICGRRAHPGLGRRPGRAQPGNAPDHRTAVQLGDPAHRARSACVLRGGSRHGGDRHGGIPGSAERCDRQAGRRARSHAAGGHRRSAASSAAVFLPALYGRRLDRTDARHRLPAKVDHRADHSRPVGRPVLDLQLRADVLL